ncbi:pre-mRNA-splicing factor CWC25 [Capsicum galapagoense]
MALKFLNKKGWHTGSLRNIENVWKAEQKHEAEQKKLEELRKQIQEERERSEFRQLQEQAGLVPRQERLEFLYDSGLAVGKGSSSGFESLSKPTEPVTTAVTTAEPSSSSKPQASVPGALFEDKPQSSNDAWRKLHSDPLLMIRQREQEALARVKNNPVQMAMIRKSVETMKNKDKIHDDKEKDKCGHKHRDKKSKHRHSKSKHLRNSSPRQTSDPDEYSSEDDSRRQKESRKDKKFNEEKYSRLQDPEGDYGREKTKIRHDNLEAEKYERQRRSDPPRHESHHNSRGHTRSDAPRHESRHNSRKPVRLSEEERAARLQEMQRDAEVHEEQRWKRLKKADEKDAKEAVHAGSSGGRNFLDAAQRSVYGAGKGGSSTIEESVRRRTHYSQRGEASEGNAFRR